MSYFTGTPTLSITPASVSATIGNQTEVYGAGDPALNTIGVTLTGLINNANVYTWNGTVSINDSALTSTASALTRSTGENVGSYNITAGTFITPSSNYNAPTLTGTPTLTITKASDTATIVIKQKCTAQVIQRSTPLV